MRYPHDPVKARLLMLGALVVALCGCGGESSLRGTANSGTEGPGSTPAEIAQASAEAYDDNVNGLITGATLRRWIGNWERERPPGITGKLVILQAAHGPQGFRYIRPDNVNVFTYVESGWRETRFNGVTDVATSVLSGASIDALIRKYDIDVARDLIVCAQGKAEDASFFDQGLCWYSFRYWGVDRRNLAVLDGGNAHLTGGWGSIHFVEADFHPLVPGQPSPVIDRQTSRVKDLQADNTALQATLENLIDALPAQDRDDPADRFFLWDSRTLEEYSAGEATETALPAVVPLADRYASFRHGGSRQGHPRGSVNLDALHLIDRTTGRFKSKAELRRYLDGGIDAAGRGFVDGSYRHLGAGNAYRTDDLVILWSETSDRAALAQIVTAVILGLPTRVYTAGTIEWNSLSGGANDRDGDPILPANSRWRTDTLSAPDFPNHLEHVAPRNAWSHPAQPKLTAASADTPRIRAPNAARTDAAILEDRVYQSSADGGGGNPGGGGGGPVLPPNPCGG